MNNTEEKVEILIVDDRDQDVTALREILSSPNYSVVTANSGQQALRELLRKEFALILLDVVMPGLDGFEVAKLIKQRERSQHTPIIFLTAGDFDVNRLYRAYSAGAIDYLVKPVDPHIVRTKVAVFAELYRANRDLQRKTELLREAERQASELRVLQVKLNAERRYRNLAEAIPQIVWTADKHGAFDYGNRRWLEYTSVSLEAAMGNGWLQSMHPDDVERCRREWEQCVLSGSVCEMECRLRRNDNQYRWHLCRAIPDLDAGGKIVAWLGTLTDFEELIQAIQARDEFLSIASHELRTPLTALKLRLQALEQANDVGVEARHKCKSAARQAQRIERLIEDLLDVARIATGHWEMQLEEFELTEVVREVVERIREQDPAGASHIHLEASEAVRGYWDRQRIEQLITNLVGNAVRYGLGKPVRASVQADERGVRIAVRDHGIGIAPDEIPRIFERFERAGQRHNPGGLGIGLYVSRKIVEAHEGTIQLESAIGKGTTFVVSLPRAVVADSLAS